MSSDRLFPSLIDRCWFLAGPTASGKSEVAIELAERLGGELLSLDSIAVYRGMDIGTAKPTAAQQERVPHHLIDLAAPDEEFSAAAYLEAAHRVTAEIESRGATPIFVGGTPLYMKGLLRGFFVGPPADWEFRRAVEEDLRAHGAEALHARLRQVDPLSAHRLPPADVRRITRALEVNYLTGRPLSHYQVQFEQDRAAESCHVFALRLDRPTLQGRIEARVEAMFAAGLVDEVRQLEAAGGLGRTAAQAVGYREVLEHLAGRATLAETVAAVKLHTRQLAKRQETWLRSLSEVRFIDIAADEPAQSIAERILARTSAFPG
ncbi:tRNA (adenosine(37)-N6)-dimethylallyltransferase MiaA [Candidatus Laterigemmans baculatus]|uniref:tRNA (adenosine(37)-N6)-dimethylallyltransferase MiaA n=1 Tax=Candidatus Laterigemmans baculatus TaxID=2770505 RepID=UPI0013DA821E|nr:tRNA (adenosine(37)-N6)-dimethylallyltransferase MiaA [Candidatus Laterigemmans baculatus]